MEPRTYDQIPLYVRIQAGSRMANRARSGEKVTDIAADLGVSRSHLYALETKFREDPSMADRPREGRPEKIDEEMEEKIIQQIRIDPFQTSSKIQTKVNHRIEEEKQISSSSVRRVAIKREYIARRPLQKPPLSTENKASRLNFGKIHKDHTIHFWKNVIFMDETILRMHPTDSRKRVRRQQGTRISQEHTVPLYKYGGKGVMFWGCMTWEGLGPLVQVEGTLTGDSYGSLLMQYMPEVLQLMTVRSPYLIEDQSRVHTTKDVNLIKEDLNLRNLNPPPYSPDFNIIESLWAIWKDKVRARTPQTLEDLKRVALEEWRKITLEDIRSLYKSMLNRIEAVIKAAGNNTKY